MRKIYFLVFLFSFKTFLSFGNDQNIKVFFNNDDTKKYLDPYRKIMKPGVDFEKIIIDQINNAKSTIEIAVQELNLTRVARALVKAHKERNIRVRIILEDKYNKVFGNVQASFFENLADHGKRKLAEHLAFIGDKKFLTNETFFTYNMFEITQRKVSFRDAIAILRNAKVPVRDDSMAKPKYPGLMHHKFIIIDQSHLIFMSNNLTRSGTHGDFNEPSSIGNANALMTINSKNLSRYFLNEFNLMWNGKFKHAKPFRGTKNYKAANSSLGVKFSPTNLVRKTLPQRDWAESTNGVIAQNLLRARSSIHSSLFVFTAQGISNSLNRLKSQKPSMIMEFLIDPKFATRSSSSLLDMWKIELPYKVDKSTNPYKCSYSDKNVLWRKAHLEGGVPRLKQSDKLHHKFAVIDRETVIFGSHNWSRSANEVNDEAILIIKNKKIASEFLREHNRLYKDAYLGPSSFFLERVKRIKASCR